MLDLVFYGISKYNKIILAVFALVFALVMAVVILYMYFHIESFIDVSPSTTDANLFDYSSYDKQRLIYDSSYEKNRTQLYGSLFLDKLNEQIKGMTDPPIQYDTKRIDIIKYSDVLL